MKTPIDIVLYIVRTVAAARLGAYGLLRQIPSGDMAQPRLSSASRRLFGCRRRDHRLRFARDGRPKPSQTLATTQRLTEEQIACLVRCSEGNTLRFEALELVDAIVAAGYAHKSIMGVVTVTTEGQQYLATALRRSRALHRW